MSNRIAIIKDGHEGGIHIDGLTGQVIQEGDLPAWAEGLVVASFSERTGWYEQRMGQQLPETMRKPEVLKMDDLEWLGLDAEGDEVHIEANPEVRMELLAGYLGLDLTDADSFENSPLIQQAIARGEATATYRTNPTEEATLAEIEQEQFGEVERKAANG